MVPSRCDASGDPRVHRGVRTTRSTAALVAVALLVLVGCGDDDEPEDAGTTTSTTSTTAADSTTTTTEPVGLEQPAIWPAADVVFETPEEAAEDFVREVLGVPPALGEFQQGDARSGEIEVFSPGEGETPTSVVRGRLLLRQLGADDGWFVLAAANDNASISTPASGADVPAGPLTVSGRARGFEASVVVRAVVAGDADDELDQQVTTGGALETPEPFTVTVDLSEATPGSVVALLVQGGTGLETDPGDFGAIPVVIAG
jgi:Immunoglobulin-like domain of bacterial spore germination